MTSTPVIASTGEAFNDLIGAAARFLAAEAAPPACNVQEAYGQVMEAARHLISLSGATAVIDRFDGDYRWLSNFHQGDPFRIPPLSPLMENLLAGGAVVPTAEHAFQAAKCVTREDLNRVLRAETPRHAKRAGRTAQLRPGWEQAKDSVMLSVLCAKFAAGTPLAGKLIATGNATLIEGTAWGDVYWGTDSKGAGKNRLGALLMAVRARLAGPAVSGLGYVQQQAWANKLVKGFNTTDVPLDIAYLHAEVSEAFDAWREGGSIGPELADVIIFTAGLAQMTGVDLSAEVASKLAVNTARIYAARANGTHRRVETAGGTS